MNLAIATVENTTPRERLRLALQLVVDADVSRLELRPKQTRILGMLLDGFCDKEIAELTGIGVKTIKHYTGSIYQAFGVHGRAELFAKIVGRR